MTQIDELVKRRAEFLREAAHYFEKRDTLGEDMAFWANHQNAENCRKTADALEAQAAENARLKERLGLRGLVVVEFNGVGHYVSEAVAARIATLERVIAWANNSLFGSHNFFLSLNGGEDNEHHLDTAIEKLKEQTRNYWSRIANLEDELDIANRQIAETGRAWTADRERLEAQIEALREALVLYRESVRIDPTMGGPRFGGANSSALRRAWEHDHTLMSALAASHRDLRNAEGEKDGVE